MLLVTDGTYGQKAEQTGPSSQHSPTEGSRRPEAHEEESVLKDMVASTRAVGSVSGARACLPNAMSKALRPRTPSRPTAIDLFCGAGGLTDGLKQAGFHVIGAVELDPIAAATYRRNHRTPTLWQEDIRCLTAKHVMQACHIAPGDLDLLAGCPPCQGFSRMRTLNRGTTADDERNDLVFEFLRFVKVLKPKTIMLENVPGLATDRRMVEFCARLEARGYSVVRTIVNAADYGVPQRRQRLLLLASRASEVTIPPAVAKRTTVRDAIGMLPRPHTSSDPLHNLPENRAPHVRELIRRIPKNGGSRSALPDAQQRRCHQTTAGFYDVYGRLAWDTVAPTITTGCTNPSKGRFLHPAQDRALTLREAALLQSFPPSYYFSLERGKEHAAAMIGNALPPRMIKVFAASIRDTMLAPPSGHEARGFRSDGSALNDSGQAPSALHRRAGRADSSSNVLRRSTQR